MIVEQLRVRFTDGNAVCELDVTNRQVELYVGGGFENIDEADLDQTIGVLQAARDQLAATPKEDA